MLMMLCAFGVTFHRLLPSGGQGLSVEETPALPGWSLQPVTDALTPSVSALDAVAPWLVPFWIAGVCIVHLRNIAGWIAMCRLRRRGICYAAKRWQKEVARLSSTLRLSHRIPLFESSLTDVPVVLGHFRPLILVPIGLFAGLPPAHVEAILPAA
jgi:hypothetical protein